jgi:hypothetical protein
MACNWTYAAVLSRWFPLIVNGHFRAVWLMAGKGAWWNNREASINPFLSGMGEQWHR